VSRAAPFLAVLAGLGLSAAALAQDWSSHVGSFKTEAEAEAGWRRLKNAAGEALKDREAALVDTDVPGKGQWIRVLIGVDDRAAANRLCAALKERGQYCVPLQQSGGGGRRAMAPMAAEPSARKAPDTAKATEPAKATARPKPITTAKVEPAKGSPAPTPTPTPPAMPAPAEDADLLPFYGTWARSAADCGKSVMGLRRDLVTLLDGNEASEMSCKLALAGADLLMDCADGSKAKFEVIDDKEIVLRAVQPSPDMPVRAVDQLWRRCGEIRR